MGLLNKLKNVLFEEEEIEETIEEVSQDERIHMPKSTMELPKVNKESKKEKPVVKYDVEEEPDRELFQAERTFDFPAFDEDEFEDFSSLVKEEPVKKEEEVFERKIVTPKKNEYTPTRVVNKVREEEPKKAFKPSPVISPVYGILDKNYKKEDILTREEANDKKNVKLDVDSVRKKAFGTLEEDLATTITETIKAFTEEPVEKVQPVEEVEKEIIRSVSEPEEVVNEVVEEPIEEIIENQYKEENLENLLEEAIDEEIDVTKEMELPSRLDKNNYEDEEELISEEINEIEEEIIESEVPKVEEQKEENLEDTLENDLFDLIDSMYENGDDE